eukprot:2921234-Pyramimonas_sp.AAC.2
MSACALLYALGPVWQHPYVNVFKHCGAEYAKDAVQEGDIMSFCSLYNGGSDKHKHLKPHTLFLSDEKQRVGGHPE